MMDGCEGADRSGAEVLMEQGSWSEGLRGEEA